VYNVFGNLTSLTLGNNAVTTFGYYGVGGANDTTEGYYGRLWEIKTVNAGSTVLQDVKHTWDAGGNLSQCQTLLTAPSTWETETFAYDSLDRIIADGGTVMTDSPGDADNNGVINSDDVTYVQNVILWLIQLTNGCDANQDGTINIGDVTRIELMMGSAGYSYDQIGNITTKNGDSYTYSVDHPHAVNSAGSMSYTYDANGNMTSRPRESGRPVLSLTLTNGGSGYTSAPTITIIGGGGSGATATATLRGNSVSSVTLTNSGNGYAAALERRLRSPWPQVRWAALKLPPAAADLLQRRR
jgi:hypothetical protein